MIPPIIIVLGTTIPTLLLLALFAQEYLHVRSMPHLSPPEKPQPDGNQQPLVSIIIPARNEAHTLARCLEGALTQTYEPYEVLVVDDASTDATPEILARYAAHHKRLRIIAGAPLPAGWTGKSYACWQATQAARGAWLLFLDADTVPQPTLIPALLTHARRFQADMVTLFPFLELGSFWERLILPPFMALIHAVFPFERVNAPDAPPDDVLANGQCIFVRRSAYDAIGGHQTVRSAVLDDVLLAQTLRRAGFRMVVALGLNDVRVRMYTNGREVLEGLTKNATAGYSSGGKRSTSAGMRLFSMALIPPLFLAWGVLLLVVYGGVLTWAVLIHSLVVAIIAVTVWAIRLRHLYALHWGYALLWPVGLLSYGMITLRSLWRIWSGRGVIWKGRTYAGT